MLVEMELNKIIIDEKRQEQIIVLKEKNGQRLLPIVIGILEATAIKMKVGGIVPPRPLTNDLFKNLMEELNVKLEKVIIDNIKNNTFYAKLVIVPLNGGTKYIDARPSDSIALAVRMQAAIFVEDAVLKASEISNPAI